MKPRVQLMWQQRPRLSHVMLCALVWSLWVPWILFVLEIARSGSIPARLEVASVIVATVEIVSYVFFPLSLVAVVFLWTTKFVRTTRQLAKHLLWVSLPYAVALIVTAYAS